MSRLKNLVGQPFGNWIVLKRVSNSKWNESMWLCQCQCQSGTLKVVRGIDLVHGKSKSCGCLQKERASEANKTHGQTKTRLYRIYAGMKSRCYNPNEPAYKNYGGRGITICPEWQMFEPFKKWAMLHGYDDNLSIDRIDNNKGYSPENCRWTDRKTQNNNQRSNRLISYKGKTQTMKQWSEEYDINYHTFISRIDELGWSIEKALNTP